MPFCAKCGKQNKDSAVFCTGCGYKVSPTRNNSPTTLKENSSLESNYIKHSKVENASTFIPLLAKFYSKAGLIGSLLIIAGLFGKWLSGYGPAANGIDIITNSNLYLDEKRSLGGAGIAVLMLLVLAVSAVICLCFCIGIESINPQTYKFSRIGTISAFFLSYGILNKGVKMMTYDSNKFLVANADYPMYNVGGLGLTLSFLGCLILFFEHWFYKYIKK